LKKIARSTELGKRDYALLVVLLNTGRRLQEVASLKFQHVRFIGQRITLTFDHCKRDKTMIDTLNVANSKALLTWLHAYYGSELASLEKHAPLWITLSRNTERKVICIYTYDSDDKDDVLRILTCREYLRIEGPATFSFTNPMRR
jgi:integrase